jgi:hypothetical protein
MAKKSNVKGARFERQIAKLLGAQWGIAFERTPQSGGWGKMRTKGDLVSPPEVNFRYHIECKNQEGWQLDSLLSGKGDKRHRSWWDQCQGGALQDKREPLLIFSRNLAPIYVRWFPAGKTEELLIKPYIEMTDGSRIATLEALLETISREDVILAMVS